jgi:alpha-1,2-mannosyltransferase
MALSQEDNDHQGAKVLSSGTFLPGIVHPARAVLGMALLIACYQFAPYLAHLLGSPIGLVRAMQPADFPTFYHAAVTYRAGGNPYELSTLAEGAKGAHIFPFLHPPTSLPVFFPLALAGFDASLLVFELLSFLCLVYVLFVVIRTAEEEQWPKSWRLVSLVALTSFSAIDLTFNTGQVNIIATAAIVFAWMSARESGGRGEVASAAGLLIAILLKTYPALLLLPFLIRRDFKVLGWFAVFAAGDALLSWITVGHAVWQAWIVNVMPTGRFGITPYGLFPPSALSNQSLNGALSRMLGEATTAELGPFVQAAVLGLTILACWTFRRQGRRGFYDYGFGAMSVASFLIAPLSWYHHFVFLIPALVAFASILNLSEYHDSLGWNSALLSITIMISLKWPIIFSGDPAARVLRMLPILGPLALFAMFTALPLVLWWHGTSLDRHPRKENDPCLTPSVGVPQSATR